MGLKRRSTLSVSLCALFAYDVEEVPDDRRPAELRRDHQRGGAGSRLAHVEPGACGRDKKRSETLGNTHGCDREGRAEQTTQAPPRKRSERQRKTACVVYSRSDERHCFGKSPPFLAVLLCGKAWDQIDDQPCLIHLHVISLVAHSQVFASSARISLCAFRQATAARQKQPRGGISTPHPFAQNGDGDGDTDGDRDRDGEGQGEGEYEGEREGHQGRGRGRYGKQRKQGRQGQQGQAGQRQGQRQG